MLSTTASYFTTAAAVDWPSSHESFSMITTMITPDEATIELRPEPLKSRQESVLLPPTPQFEQSTEHRYNQVGPRPVALRLRSRHKETQSPTSEQPLEGTTTLRQLHPITRRAGARRYGRMKREQPPLEVIPYETATGPPSSSNISTSPKTPVSALDTSYPLPVIRSPSISPTFAPHSIKKGLDDSFLYATAVNPSFRLSTHEMSLLEALQLDLDPSNTTCGDTSAPPNVGVAGNWPWSVDSAESSISFTNPWDTSQPLFPIATELITPIKETSFMDWDSSDDEDHKGFSIRKNSALKGWKSRNASRSRLQLSSRKASGATTPTAPTDGAVSRPISADRNVPPFVRKESEVSIASSHEFSSPVSQTSFVHDGISSPISQTSSTIHNGISSPVSQASFLQNCASSPIPPVSFSSQNEVTTPKPQVPFSTQDPRSMSWSAIIKKKSSFLRDRKFSHGNSCDAEQSRSALEKAAAKSRHMSPLARTESEMRIPTTHKTRPQWFRKVSL